MVPSFTELAARPDPRLDLLALALAAEFREVDAEAALTMLDALATDVREAVAAAGPPAGPDVEAEVVGEVLGIRHGFAGDVDRYDHPDNSMLDLVLERRQGLPIVLSVVYVEVGRRAGLALAGVGLPGHFVVGHFGTTPPLLLDPFGGGGLVEADAAPQQLRPWTAHEIAMRMLNNLTAAFDRRGNLSGALHAADLRLALPSAGPIRQTVEAEHRALHARLN